MHHSNEAHSKFEVITVTDSDNIEIGFIAINNIAKFKHAFGATRIWKYSSKQEAIDDALRLSLVMTYKCALADLPYSGAKGVILENSRYGKEKLLEIYTQEVNSLQGRFITGADVGLSAQDVKFMSTMSSYIVGVKVDPVFYTAQGLAVATHTAIKHVFGDDEINGKRFAIQGLGKIGYHYLENIYQQGGIIFATDISKESISLVKKNFPNVVIVNPQEIFDIEVDVFSPCAMSNSINPMTLDKLKCAIVLGGANSQLYNDQIGVDLHNKGILYAPDYIVNAGGIISVTDEFESKDFDTDRIDSKIKNIGDTLQKVFTLSAIENKATNLISDKLAQDKIFKHR